MRTRLRPLDGSFLRIETPNAHMHVGWSAVFSPHPDRPRPSAEALAESIGSRLYLAPRFRQRIAFPPPPFSEPFWVDHGDFEIAQHVIALTDPREPVSLACFHALTDAALSTPLDRKRPLWQMLLVPRLEDGRVGMVAKVHHAMVDGLAAVDMAMLLFDASPDEPEALPSTDWNPQPSPGRVELALDSALHSTGDALKIARGAVRLALSPRRQATKVADTVRRVSAVVREDILTVAPESAVNVPIGPQRMLVRHSAEMADIRRAKERPLVAGPGDGRRVTVNDVYLAALAGALRSLALGRGESPQPLKVMVPVSVRRDDEHDGSGGNRIAFCFVELPLDAATPQARLRRVHQATSAFKSSHRSEGSNIVLSVLGVMPPPIKNVAARLAASPRTYNVTISNIPGPSEPLYMLGARLDEVYPLVPLSEDHALSVGIFGYLDRAHFGFYADPGAMPDVRDLPAAVDAEIMALAGARRRRRVALVNGAGRREPATVTPLR